MGANKYSGGLGSGLDLSFIRIKREFFYLRFTVTFSITLTSEWAMGHRPTVVDITWR